MEPLSEISHIQNATKDPIEMLTNLLEKYKTAHPHKLTIPMNIATLDAEFGVLNRNVNYRGLTAENHVTFVTQKDSRKYKNLMEDPRVSVTFHMEIPNDKGHGSETTWQVRIFGKATELTAKEISNLWKEETIFAKIRSRICECGKPIDFMQLKEAHDTLLSAYEEGLDSLPQPKVYTAFKIVPTIWDFYKADENCIGDRIQYRKCQSGEEFWNVIHVAA